MKLTNKINNQERYIIIITLVFTLTFTFIDLLEDINEGVKTGHALIEASIIIIACICILFLIRGLFKFKTKAESLSLENAKWKKEAKKYIDGLSLEIDKQLSEWELSRSEKEVAFLLLKGLSFKEIASIRS